MSTAPGLIVPNPRIPKTIGILNIVFGAAIILFGVCSGIYMAVLPMLGKTVEGMQQQMVRQADERKKVDLEALADQEKAAQTDEEKEAIKLERVRIESRPTPTIQAGMDFRKMGLTDPRVIRYYWADLTTMAVLNSLMIASGIGLVRFRDWGRRLGLWVAGLKILRLVLLQSVWIAVITPILAHGIATVATDMITQQQAAMGGKGVGPAMRQLTTLYGIMYTAMGIATILIGSIYPAVCLWLLSRPRAKAACLGPVSVRAMDS